MRQYFHTCVSILSFSFKKKKKELIKGFFPLFKKYLSTFLSRHGGSCTICFSNSFHVCCYLWLLSALNVIFFQRTPAFEVLVLSFLWRKWDALYELHSASSSGWRVTRADPRAPRLPAMSDTPSHEAAPPAPSAPPPGLAQALFGRCHGIGLASGAGGAGWGWGGCCCATTRRVRSGEAGAGSGAVRGCAGSAGTGPRAGDSRWARGGRPVRDARGVGDSCHGGFPHPCRRRAGGSCHGAFPQPCQKVAGGSCHEGFPHPCRGWGGMSRWVTHLQLGSLEVQVFWHCGWWLPAGHRWSEL